METLIFKLGFTQQRNDVISMGFWSKSNREVASTQELKKRVRTHPIGANPRKSPAKQMSLFQGFCV